MSTTTTRTGDIGQNFQQTTQGETPNSISISTNAKGAAQLDIKLFYASPSEMIANAEADIYCAIEKAMEALDKHGIRLAGQEGK